CDRLGTRLPAQGLPVLRKSAGWGYQALPDGWAQVMAKGAGPADSFPRSPPFDGKPLDDGRCESGSGPAHHAPQRPEANDGGLWAPGAGIPPHGGGPLVV